MFRLVYCVKATLITYNTRGLNKSESSKISKGLIGYLDKSNKGKYVYKRSGLINSIRSVVVSRSTFIIPRNKTKDIVSYIKSRGGKVSLWMVDVPQEYLKN